MKSSVENSSFSTYLEDKKNKNIRQSHKFCFLHPSVISSRLQNAKQTSKSYSESTCLTFFLPFFHLKGNSRSRLDKEVSEKLFMNFPLERL